LKHRLHLHLVALVISVALLCSCSSKSRQSTNQSTPQEQSFSTKPPFLTREPEKYQAERIVTFTNAAGGATTSKLSIARAGDSRREEMEQGGQKIVFLDNGGSRLVLLPEARIYSEVTTGDGSVAAMDSLELGSSPERLLHEQPPISTSYQKLGTEVINGRTTTRYQLIVNTSPAANVSKDETFLWLDESLGMLIKSESKSPDGRTVVMELTDISLDVDDNLFRIPEGYKKVATAEIRQRLPK
jgi:outer membrane lipoprotein-sorting protein